MLAIGIVVAVGAIAKFNMAGAEDGACDRFAAPNGSDSAAGTEAQPFATAQKLVDALGQGQTGCLRQGTYRGEGDDMDIKFSNPRVSLRSYPGERATLVGHVWVAEGADGVTVSDLDINGNDGRGAGSPVINADNAVFRGNDVSNENTDICFIVGSADYGRARGTVIEGNRIHNCGKLPAENHDHGIYVSDADDTVIRNNLIYDNADRGVQLYPDAQRTKITGNVIDGNGQGIIFSGDFGTASNDNKVEGNVITNSRIRDNVESFYPDDNPVGKGNVVRRNCISGGVRDDGDGGILEPEVGFRASGNKLNNPRFTNRRRKDFRLKRTSPCRRLVGATVAAAAAG